LKSFFCGYIYVAALLYNMPSYLGVLSPDGKYGAAFRKCNINNLQASSKWFVEEPKGDTASYPSVGNCGHHHHFLPYCLWVVPPLVQSVDSPEGLLCCTGVISVSWNLQHWYNAIFIGEERDVSHMDCVLVHHLWLH